MTIAFSYYKKSADLGYADAITKLGDYFYSGILFKKSYSKFYFPELICKYVPTLFIFNHIPTVFINTIK